MGKIHEALGQLTYRCEAIWGDGKPCGGQASRVANRGPLNGLLMCTVCEQVYLKTPNEIQKPKGPFGVQHQINFKQHMKDQVKNGLKKGK